MLQLYCTKRLSIAVLENTLVDAFSSELYCFGILLFLEYLIWASKHFTIILYRKNVD
jgi:hypothetical protein